MFQNLLKLLVPLSNYTILKIKVIFWYFKRKYVFSDSKSNDCDMLRQMRLLHDKFNK